MYKFTFCMHDCKNIDTFIPGKMGKFLEKSGNFVSEKKWEPCAGKAGRLYTKWNGMPRNICSCGL